MPGEGQERALLIDRCWSIYLLLTEHVSVPSAFHEEFPVLVERATHSGLFHLTVRLSDEHSLYIRGNTKSQAINYTLAATATP